MVFALTYSFVSENQTQKIANSRKSIIVNENVYRQQTRDSVQLYELRHKSLADILM